MTMGVRTASWGTLVYASRLANPSWNTLYLRHNAVLRHIQLIKVAEMGLQSSFIIVDVQSFEFGLCHSVEMLKFSEILNLSAFNHLGGTLYDVKHIFNYTLDETRCHCGQAPNLRDCIALFGRESLRKVMRGSLDTFIDFVKCKDKPNNVQRDTICWLAMQQFGSLKITEWLLFSIKAMSGQFGKFYNTLDPIDITTAIRSWFRECEAFRNEYRAEQVRKAREKEREEVVMTSEEREEAIRTLERIGEKLKAKTK